MANIVVAMLWELWRVSRRDMALRISGQVLLSVALFLVARQRQDIGWGLSDAEPESAVWMRSFYAGVAMVILLLANLVPCGLGSLDSRSGFGLWLGFTRPVSTSLLVALPLVYVAAAAAICFIVPALLIRLLFQHPMPLLAPAVGLGCTVACLMAAVWSPAHYAGRIVSVIGVVAVASAGLVAFTLQRRDPGPVLLSFGDPQFFQGGWLYFSVVCSAACLALCICTVCVDRQRHGERWRKEHAPRQRAFAPRVRQRVTSPESPWASGNAWRAQVWFEFRRGGRRVLLTAAIVAIVTGLLMAAVSHAAPAKGTLAGAWLVVLAASLIAYQLLGVDWTLGIVRNGGLTELSSFDAIRPMRCDQMIVVKVLVVSAASALGLALALAAAVPQAAWQGDLESVAAARPQLMKLAAELRWFDWLMLPLGVAALWCIGTSALIGGTLWSILHHRLAIACFASGGLLLIVKMIEQTQHANWSWLWLGVQGAMVLLCASLAVACVILALRRRIVGRGYVITCILLWTVAQAAAWRMSTVLGLDEWIGDPWLQMAAATSSAAAPITGLLLAPLALSMHRHR